MKEKEFAKINLTAVLLIIAIIVIIIMGCYIYKLSTGKNNNPEQNVQGNQLSNSQNTTTEVTNTQNDFSDAEIKDAIQNYLILKGALAASPKFMLSQLGYEDFEKSGVTDDHYIETNIKYSEFKDKIYGYMTEQAFEISFAKLYKDINGYVYYFNGGGSGYTYKVNSIALKGDYSNLNYIAHAEFMSEGIDEEQNIEFHIGNYNGQCVISYCE